MSRLTIEETIKERIRYDELNNDINLIPNWLKETTIPHYDEYKKCFLDGVNCKRYTDLRIVTDVLHDLEEQGRLIDWKRTSEEKPGSTRHVIVADGAIISHYGYYLKPKDKWFTDWTCEKEIDAPMFWMDMPEPPEESLHGDCVAKMDEVENE